MSNDSELQARLAVEFMSANHCQECKFYRYGKREQHCMFHSVSVDECHIVNLHLTGELYATARNAKVNNSE